MVVLSFIGVSDFEDELSFLDGEWINEIAQSSVGLSHFIVVSEKLFQI